MSLKYRMLIFRILLTSYESVQQLLICEVIGLIVNNFILTFLL